MFIERKNESFKTLLNELVKSSLNSGNKDTLNKLQSLLKMDDINFSYFLLLLKQKNKSISNEFKIIDDRVTNKKNKILVLSTATASKNELKHIPIVEYETISSNNKYLKTSQNVTLLIKKMHAGLGSSIERTSYLAKRLGKNENEVKMSAKGLDLFVKIPDRNGSEVSLAELGLIKLIISQKRGEFGGIIFHDIVGPETQEGIKNLWKKSSPFFNNLTYEELINNDENISYSGSTYEDHLPTIDERNELTYSRHAPGGHGLFGVETLMSLSKSENIDKKYIISAISNGEDLSASPDPYMLGWMKENDIPIVMVTTDKTEIDKKGGQIVLVIKENSFYPTLLELAQAERSGQKKLFEELGLRPNDNKVFFNTNMILFNHTVLIPLLNSLLKKIGENRFLEIIAPDLILNRKEQVDDDGITRSYYQMEGAIGSSILNLDKYFRETYSKPIVHFINVSRNFRTDFFSPIKIPFDFFMQFKSDRFSLDREKMCLINNRKGKLPLVSFKGPKSNPELYKNLQYVLDAFKDSSILELDELHIEGAIKINSAILKGKVILKNELDSTADFSLLAKKSKDIRFIGGKPIFENIFFYTKSDNFCINKIS